MNGRNHIYFLTVYDKTEVTDLTPAQIKILKQIVKEIDGENDG